MVVGGCGIGMVLLGVAVAMFVVVQVNRHGSDL